MGVNSMRESMLSYLSQCQITVTLLPELVLSSVLLIWNPLYLSSLERLSSELFPQSEASQGPQRRWNELQITLQLQMTTNQGDLGLG